MKNKFLTLLTVTMLAGSIFVGCGGNETGADANNGSGTNINTEADVKEEVDLSLYTEFSSGYGITDEANLDYSLADGELMQEADWDDVGQIIKLTGTVDFYSGEKVKGGFLKSGIECIYYRVKDDWSVLHIDLDGTMGITYVRTDELTANMEVIGTVSDIEENIETSSMSEKAEEYFDKIRAGVAEYNETTKELQKQYPNAGYQLLEETTSSENMEYVTTFTHGFDNEDDYATIMDVIRQLGFNQLKSKYYLEYVSETETSVEYKLYLAE